MEVYRMGIKSLFGFGQARDKPTNKAADAGYSCTGYKDRR